MTAARNYPLPRPTDDPKFTGLGAELAEALVRHGYPPLSTIDRAELQLVLFRFLYTAADHDRDHDDDGGEAS